MFTMFPNRVSVNALEAQLAEIKRTVEALERQLETTRIAYDQIGVVTNYVGYLLSNAGAALQKPSPPTGAPDAFVVSWTHGPLDPTSSRRDVVVDVQARASSGELLKIKVHIENVPLPLPPLTGR